MELHALYMTPVGLDQASEYAQALKESLTAGQSYLLFNSKK